MLLTVVLAPYFSSASTLTKLRSTNETVKTVTVVSTNASDTPQTSATIDAIGAKPVITKAVLAVLNV